MESLKLPICVERKLEEIALAQGVSKGELTKRVLGEIEMGLPKDLHEQLKRLNRINWQVNPIKTPVNCKQTMNEDPHLPRKDLINEKTQKIEIRISGKNYRRLLFNAASEGEPIETAAARLLKVGLATPDERAKLADFLTLKAAILRIDPEELIQRIED